MSKNKSFLVRFIERRNLTEKRPIYWIVKIVKFIKDSIRTIFTLVVGLILGLIVLIWVGWTVIKYRFIAVSIWILIVFITGYLRKLSKEAKKSSWRTLVASKHLTFVPGKFLRHDSYITGTYRNHHLKLETFTESVKLEDPSESSRWGDKTRLLVSVDTLAQGSPQNEPYLPNEQVSSKDAMSLLTPTSPHYILKGAQLKRSIAAQTVKQKVYLCYVQGGIENDPEYLGFLFDLLSGLADAYSAVVAPGGTAVSFLKDEIARSHHELIAAELLRAIARDTTARIGDRSPQVLCPLCLTRYTAHKVLLESLECLTYYGCRICGQSREFLEGRLVAVLDSRMDTERVQQDGTLRVNWLVRRALFDFDEVEIVRATDEDVERFAVQVGNDTDDFRRSRYQDMSCTIAPDGRLSENTLRILRNTFG